MPDTFTQEFKRLQDQKARPIGGVEGRVLTNIAFWAGEQWARYRALRLLVPELNPNRVHLVFNLIRRRLNKLIGRAMSVSGQFGAFPNLRDASAMAKAEVATKLIRALDHKVMQENLTWQIWWWLLVGGVAFEETAWLPDATVEPVKKTDDSGNVIYRDLTNGEEIPDSFFQALVAQGRAPEEFEIVEVGKPVGDVDANIYGPLQVFVDQSVKDLQKLNPDQSVMIAEVKSLEWVKAQDIFEKAVRDVLVGVREIDIVKTQLVHEGDALSNMNLRDLIPVVNGAVAEGSPDVVVVVRRYAPASRQYPRGRFTIFVPGQDEAGPLLDTPLPYSEREIPIIDYHFAPITTSFWSPDYVTDLIPPQKFLNKRFSQLAEYANSFLMGSRLLGPGVSKDSLPPADEPGVVEDGLNEQGVPMVRKEEPPQVGGWFMQTTADVVKLFNELAGSDLFQEQKFPGQLRGPLAVPMLQEILDTEWGPVFLHVGKQMARAKQMRLNRVKQFYDPIRTLHYTGKDGRDEVLEFHTDEILRTTVDYNISVDPATLLPELPSMREARIRERLNSPLGPVLYSDRRTGKIDPTKVADDLRFGDMDREDRSNQYRKLARELLARALKNQPVPTVFPFWDHASMLDEYEAVMATTEFLESSPQIQQNVLGLYDQARKYLVAQQQAIADQVTAQATQGAVAQASQQAAAKAAAEATDAAMEAVREQVKASITPPEDLVMMMTQALARGAR